MNDKLPTPDKDPLVDSESLKLRLEAARSAQDRTRVGFFAVTLISLAMLTAGWNAHLSIYRYAAQEFAALAHVDKDVAKDQDANTGIQELQKDVLREFVGNRMINISLLGIRVGADDAPILGSIALIVALIWFYLYVRRENFVVGWLLHDGNGKGIPIATKRRIFHGINSYSIFNQFQHLDEPFVNINDFPKQSSLWVFRFFTNRLLRPVTASLYLLPLFAVLGVIGLEVMALNSPSPFRVGNQSLLETLRQVDPSHAIARINRLYWSIPFALFVLGLCSTILRFKRSTEQILRQFYEAIYTAVPESSPVIVDPGVSQ